MQFTIRSALLFTAGIAVVASAASAYGELPGLLAIVLFTAALGASIGGARYWRACLFGGLGAVLALWLGLPLHAFVLPWGPAVEGSRQGYQQFVRDTWLPQLLFLAVEGLLLGFLVATLVWTIRRMATRPGKSAQPPSAKIRPDRRGPRWATTIGPGGKKRKQPFSRPSISCPTNPSYAVTRVGLLVAKDLRSFSGRLFHYICTNSSILRRRRGRVTPRRWSRTFWALSGSVTQRRRTVPL